MLHNARKLAVLLVIITVVASCRFYFDTTKDNLTVNKTSGSTDHAKNLAMNVCAGCHYDPEKKLFTGKYLDDLPKIAGKLYSANLTHSAEYGRADKYTDAELFYLLKTGIARNGKFMPYMMRPMMADEDVNEIIAFFRSNDPMLAAWDSSAGKTKINLIGRVGIRLGAKPQPYNKGVPRPDENNATEYGKYLVAVIGCYHCHSKKQFGLDFMDPEKSKGYMAGGMKLKSTNGKIRSANITPDTETGIGRWGEEDFKKAVIEGVSTSGRELRPPMPRFKNLTDKQVHAIFTYIKSLPPVHHKI